MTQTPPPRTRRSLLAGAAAAGGAFAAQALVRPRPVAAADVVLGAVNTVTGATTIRNDEAVSTAKAIVGTVLYDGSGGSTASVQGRSNAVNCIGLLGVAMAGNSKDVLGRSANGTGVYGEATGTTGVIYGVRGTTPSTGGTGVQGVSTATWAARSVCTARSPRLPAGVSRGSTPQPTASACTGRHDGHRCVRCSQAHGTRTGVYGEPTGSTGTNLRYGVYGSAASAHGVGVRGDGPTLGSGASDRCMGYTATPRSGVYGLFRSTGNSGTGVFGRASRGVGVRGITDGTGSYGVLGSTSGEGSIGVYGAAPDSSGYAINGSAGGWAGYFAGDVRAPPRSCARGSKHPGTSNGSLTVTRKGGARLRKQRRASVWRAADRRGPHEHAASSDRVGLPVWSGAGGHVDDDEPCRPEDGRGSKHFGTCRDLVQLEVARASSKSGYQVRPATSRCGHAVRDAGRHQHRVSPRRWSATALPGGVGVERLRAGMCPGL
jgi:hypothetical protein